MAPADALHLRSEQKRDAATQLLPPWTIAPIGQGDFTRVRFVFFENARMRRDEFLVEHIEVRLFFERHGTVVEIGRSHRGPAVIDDEVFAVETRGLVFEKTRTSLQQ